MDDKTVNHWSVVVSNEAGEPVRGFDYLRLDDAKRQKKHLLERGVLRVGIRAANRWGESLFVVCSGNDEEGFLAEFDTEACRTAITGTKREVVSR